MLYSDDNLITEGEVRYFPLKASNIKSIFIGLKCNMTIEDMLRRLHIWQLNDVKVYKMEQSQDGYKLSYEPDVYESVRSHRAEQIKSVILEAVKDNDIQRIKNLLAQ